MPGLGAHFTRRQWLKAAGVGFVAGTSAAGAGLHVIHSVEEERLKQEAAIAQAYESYRNGAVKVTLTQAASELRESQRAINAAVKAQPAALKEKAAQEGQKLSQERIQIKIPANARISVVESSPLKTGEETECLGIEKAVFSIKIGDYAFPIACDFSESNPIPPEITNGVQLERELVMRPIHLMQAVQAVKSGCKGHGMATGIELTICGRRAIIESHTGGTLTFTAGIKADRIVLTEAVAAR